MTLDEILQLLVSKIGKDLKAPADDWMEKPHLRNEVLKRRVVVDPAILKGLLSAPAPAPEEGAEAQSEESAERKTGKKVVSVTPEEANTDAMLRLVYELSKQDDVKEILREAKDARPSGGKHDVLVSGDGFQDVVETNLRRALGEGFVSKEKAFELIRRVEENGRQHIFYYRVPARDKSFINFDDVGTTLFGKAWQARMNFPRFVVTPPQFLWADFREIGEGDSKVGGAKENSGGWILKAYTAGLKKEEESHTFETGMELTIRELTRHRAVLIARWKPKLRLLELRVPFGYGKQGAEDFLQQLKAQLGPLLNSVEEWDLADCRNLLMSRKWQPKLYTLAALSSLDEDGVRTKISCASFEKDLSGSQTAADKLDVATEAEEECADTTVIWQAAPQSGITNKIRTPMAGVATNEVAIPSRVTPEELDYVTFRLVDFAEHVS